jgi:hypothetical protein
LLRWLAEWSAGESVASAELLRWLAPKPRESPRAAPHVFPFLLV